MKKTAIIYLLLTLLLASCGDEKPLPAEEKISYHSKAAKMRIDGAPAEEYIAMQERAVREVREGTCTEDPVDVLSQMGYFLLRVSEYAKALDYFQEAADYRRARPDSVTTGDITLLGTLATLYSRLDMHDEALAINSEAMKISREIQNFRMIDLYRMRAAMFPPESPADSVLHCYEMAKAYIPKAGYLTNGKELQKRIDSEIAIWKIENHEEYPDSLEPAIRVLERNIDREGNTIRDTESFILGMGYFVRGQHAKGIPLMEDALHSFERKQWTESIYWSYEMLTKLYAKNRLYDRLAQFYPRFNELRDSVEAEKRLNAAIAADIRYRASKKEQENRILDMELTVAQQRNLILIILIIIGVAVLALTIRYNVLRNRANRLKRLELKQQISELISTRQQLNSRIESLVAEINSSRTENAASQLSPELLKMDEEGKFRRMFEALYPNFIPKLKEKSSKLTPNDELVCMLIYLRQTNEEIALCLGITRMSVNTARYRIRSRLSLPKEVDLDEFITSMVV